MALQGTLDTFSLPDVLRLLATTAKSGCLHIDGDRGRGSVWIDDGAVVAAEADRALGEASVDEVVFEMLRFSRGSFNFAAGEQATSAGEPVDVEGTLKHASQLLDEWRELEVVVPSLTHRVAMAPELTVEQVTIDASRWEALVAIAGGRSVGELAETLGQGELGISRTVSDLVELGVAVVEAPSAARMSSRRGVGDTAARTNSPDLPRRGRNDQNGGGHREPSPSMPLSDGLTSGINWAQSAEAGTLADPTGDPTGPGPIAPPSTPSAPLSAVRKPATAAQFNEAGTNGSHGTNGANGNGRGTATPAGGVGLATPAGGNHLEIPSKAPRRASGNGRSTRNRRTGPTPAMQALTTPPLPTTRNGQALVKPPIPSPGYPTTDVGERERPPTNGRASRTAMPTMPASPGDMGRGATIPVPPPESARGPLLPPSLDTGRLGPSPRPSDTGQIPAVSAASLPPDLSWAADDQSPPPPPTPDGLSSPFSGLGPAAPAPGPGTVPGRLLASQPLLPSGQVVMPAVPPMPAAPPPMPAAPPPMPPANGRHDGDPAPHVVALTPDARTVVEAIVGRSGGGFGGLAMGGVGPDQMMARGHLLGFLSTVR